MATKSSPVSARDASPDEFGIKTEAQQTASQTTRNPRRRLLIILGSVAAIVVVIGLAVGLGVGLTVGRDDSGSDSDSDTGSGTISAPNSTANSTGVWQPDVNSTWQITLIRPIDMTAYTGSPSPSVDVYDFDMFDNPNTTIASLHADNKKIICYFSAGSYEPNRPDSDQFTSADKGKELDGWPGEYWLDIRSDNVRRIMANRIKIASEKGCDGIDPDNIDGYDNKNGLGLTRSDAIDFMGFISSTAASYGLGTGLKNALEIIPDVTSFIQYAVNEQCAQFNECDTYADFIQTGKPVFHIEYPKGAPDTIDATTAAQSCDGETQGTGFATVLKDIHLDGWVQYCDGTIANTTLVADS